MSFSSKPVKNTEVKSSAPPQKKPEVAELKASAPDVKDTKNKVQEPIKDVFSEKKVEEKKAEAKTTSAPPAINATTKTPVKQDTEEASEDYSEFEADDLEDNTNKKSSAPPVQNKPASNILDNIPDLKEKEKDQSPKIDFFGNQGSEKSSPDNKSMSIDNDFANLENEFNKN